jgi:hypothetical protein
VYGVILALKLASIVTPIFMTTKTVRGILHRSITEPIKKTLQTNEEHEVEEMGGLPEVLFEEETKRERFARRLEEGTGSVSGLFAMGMYIC